MPTFLGKEYGTNNGAKLENMLSTFSNAHCTPPCLSRINSIIGFHKLLEIMDYFYICDNNNLRMG
jgi:hypothetical protein